MTWPKPGWSELLRTAEQQVQGVLGGMAAPLRKRAQEVPVVYQARPTRVPDAHGADLGDDLMGLFVGLPFPESESGATEISPQIFLYLENIWDEAEGDLDIYCEEVRTTYLHELGHYLGLEEDQLEERGLE